MLSQLVKGLVDGRPFRIVSVTEFGAKGNGVADDTAALQSAIDAVNAAAPESRILWVPPGVYRFTGTLSITSHYLKIFGLHRSMLRKDFDGSGISVQANHVSIEGLRIDGGNRYGAILYFAPNSSNWEVRNCYLHSSAQRGILVEGGYIGLIASCIIEDCAECGIRLYSLPGAICSQVRITDNCYVKGCGTATGGGGIQFGASFGVIIRDCTISSNPGFGISIINGSTVWEISGCQLEANGLDQIQIDGGASGAPSSGTITATHISSGSSNGIRIIEGDRIGIRNCSILYHPVGFKDIVIEPTAGIVVLEANQIGTIGYSPNPRAELASFVVTPGTTLGSVVKRMEVRSPTGTLLGYIPVYDTIT